MGFNDDGLGAAMAESALRDRATRGEDRLARHELAFDWMDARLTAIEAALGLEKPEFPKGAQ